MTARQVSIIIAAVVAAAAPAAAQQQQQRMGFFLTSAGTGKGANLGGLEGADRHCAMLADAVGVGNVTWRAYLSLPAAQGRAAVNAKDRIGNGPWYNSKGVLIAQNVADLHGDNSKWTKQTVLNEKGEVVNGRGDTPNRHDILTGSQEDGTAFSGDADTTCGGWTSDANGQG
ncbi:MAG: lectin, partial [Longimicrobiales bacterium]